jgi:two-component system, sensor histidine kinase PdtaS
VPIRSRATDWEPGRIVLLGSILLSVLITTAIAVLLAVSYGLLMERASGDTRSMVVALGEYVERSKTISGIVAEQTALLAAERGIDNLARDFEAHLEIRRLADRLPGESAIIVVDLEGVVVLRSDKHPPGHVRLANREWFRALQSGVSPHVGRAVMSRITGTAVYTYGVPVRTAAGEVAGYVSLGIESASVIGSETLSHYPEGVVLSILTQDGYLVARDPFPADLIGVAFPIPDEETGRSDGMVTLVQPMDGRAAVVSHRKVSDLGLVAVANIPTEVILRPFRLAAMFGVPFVGFVLIGVFFLTRTALTTISERERTAVTLQRTLADNKVLFDEVHHRVKNNLQIISSLLMIQSSRSTPEARLALEVAAGRVRSIALVHEQVYSGKSPSEIDLSWYLERLAKSVGESLNTNNTVTLLTELQPIQVDLSRAVPIGLVAAEVLTNCYKHGFRESKGVLKLVLQTDGEKNCLVISDDGPGLPANVQTCGNFGMTIIRALTQQLGGSSGFENEGGTTFWLEWPAMPNTSSRLAEASWE